MAELILTMLGSFESYTSDSGNMNEKVTDMPTFPGEKKVSIEPL